MTAVVSLLAILLLGLVLAWLIGSFVLRAGGLLLILAGLVALATGSDAGAGAVALLVGVVAWLGGHWIYAYRHHEYRGPLARRIFLQMLPERADPTRRWGIPVVPASHDPHAR
jgi:hypothetical protein